MINGVDIDDCVAMINAWSLNDLNLHELLQIAIQPSTIEFVCVYKL